GFRYPQSEELVTLYRNVGTIPTEILYANELADRNATTPYVPLAAEEYASAKLKSIPTDEQRLVITFSGNSPAQFDVTVDGKILGQVRETLTKKGIRIIGWDLQDSGNEILVEVKNLNPSSPLFLKRLAVEHK